MHGIQPGTTAFDKYSKDLDDLIKNTSKSLIDEMKDLGYTYKTKLKKDNHLLIGCSPDGGLWYKDDILVCVFEAKKQGKAGNAIERWCKNMMICYSINPKIRYITFGSREGFEPGEYCYNFGQTMMNLEKSLGFTDLNKEYNTLYHSGQSWFYNVDCFSEKFIRDIMKKAITGVF
jgi:hypothetical protein